MDCDHKDRAKLKRYHTHNKDVPEGFRTFSVDWYFCPRCKCPVQATIVLPSLDAKPISAYSAQEFWLMRKGLMRVPPDTIIEPTLEVAD